MLPALFLFVFMMTSTQESLPQHRVKLTITVPHEDLLPALTHAAQHISEEKPIPGFRPGKADYDAVKRAVGEMTIYETALEEVVRASLQEALTSSQIHTVGSPKIEVVKLAPQNDLIYTAEVSLLPRVLTLGDWKTLQVKAESTEISEKVIEDTVHDLIRAQTKEIRGSVGEAATAQDKLVVDLRLFKEKVPVEGGQALGHAVYLNEAYYIPGFTEKLVGAKEGDHLSFDLTFPTEHYQKHLAGALITFEVTAKELYHLEHPEADDAFAQSLGQPTLTALKERIVENLRHEKEETEKARQEKILLEELVKTSTFDEIPDLLLNEEIQKMLQELEYHVSEQGLTLEVYLRQMKKSLGDLKVDFAAPALMRVKVALVLQELAKQEQITVSAEELDKALLDMAKNFEDEETKRQLMGPVYRAHLEARLRNRKVIEKLLDQVTPKTS